MGCAEKMPIFSCEVNVLNMSSSRFFLHVHNSNSEMFDVLQCNRFSYNEYPTTFFYTETLLQYVWTKTERKVMNNLC
jgi:hypothetical protein